MFNQMIQILIKLIMVLNLVQKLIVVNQLKWIIQMKLIQILIQIHLKKKHKIIKLMMIKQKQQRKERQISLKMVSKIKLMIISV